MPKVGDSSIVGVFGGTIIPVGKKILPQKWGGQCHGWLDPLSDLLADSGEGVASSGRGRHPTRARPCYNFEPSGLPRLLGVLP